MTSSFETAVEHLLQPQPRIFSRKPADEDDESSVPRRGASKPQHSRLMKRIFGVAGSATTQDVPLHRGSTYTEKPGSISEASMVLLMERQKRLEKRRRQQDLEEILFEINRQAIEAECVAKQHRIDYPAVASFSDVQQKALTALAYEHNNRGKKPFDTRLTSNPLSDVASESSSDYPGQLLRHMAALREAPPTGTRSSSSTFVDSAGSHLPRALQSTGSHDLLPQTADSAKFSITEWDGQLPDHLMSPTFVEEEDPVTLHKQHRTEGWNSSVLLDKPIPKLYVAKHHSFEPTPETLQLPHVEEVLHAIKTQGVASALPRTATTQTMCALFTYGEPLARSERLHIVAPILSRVVEPPKPKSYRALLEEKVASGEIDLKDPEVRDIFLKTMDPESYYQNRVKHRKPQKLESLRSVNNPADKSQHVDVSSRSLSAPLTNHKKECKQVSAKGRAVSTDIPDTPFLSAKESLSNRSVSVESSSRKSFDTTTSNPPTSPLISSDGSPDRESSRRSNTSRSVSPVGTPRCSSVRDATAQPQQVDSVNESAIMDTHPVAESVVKELTETEAATVVITSNGAAKPSPSVEPVKAVIASTAPTLKKQPASTLAKAAKPAASKETPAASAKSTKKLDGKKLDGKTAASKKSASLPKEISVKLPPVVKPEANEQSTCTATAPIKNPDSVPAATRPATPPSESPERIPSVLELVTQAVAAPTDNAVQDDDAYADDAWSENPSPPQSSSAKSGPSASSCMPNQQERTEESNAINVESGDNYDDDFSSPERNEHANSEDSKSGDCVRLQMRDAVTSNQPEPQDAEESAEDYEEEFDSPPKADHSSGAVEGPSIVHPPKDDSISVAQPEDEYDNDAFDSPTGKEVYADIGKPDDEDYSSDEDVFDDAAPVPSSKVANFAVAAADDSEGDAYASALSAAMRKMKGKTSPRGVLPTVVLPPPPEIFEALSGATSRSVSAEPQARPDSKHRLFSRSSNDSRPQYTARDFFRSEDDGSAGRLEGIPADDSHTVMRPTSRASTDNRGRTSSVQTPTSMEATETWSRGTPPPDDDLEDSFVTAGKEGGKRRRGKSNAKKTAVVLDGFEEIDVGMGPSTKKGKKKKDEKRKKSEPIESEFHDQNSAQNSRSSTSQHSSRGRRSNTGFALDL